MLKIMFQYLGNDFFQELEKYSIDSNVPLRKETINEGEKIVYIPTLLKVPSNFTHYLAGAVFSKSEAY